jgi:hypothetical protein
MGLDNLAPNIYPLPECSPECPGNAPIEEAISSDKFYLLNGLIRALSGAVFLFSKRLKK